MQKQIPRIKPSQRPKKRYVLFSLSSENKFSFPMLSNALWNAIVFEIGKPEALELGFKLMVFSKENGIFRCRRQKCEKTKKIVNSLKTVSGVKISLKTLKTSGTIKKLKEKI